MRLLDARVLRDEASCVGRKLPLTGSAEYGSMLTAGVMGPCFLFCFSC